MGKVKNNMMEVMPLRLREQLEQERIRFSMNCNTLVIRSADSKIVQLNDGTHASIPVNPIRITRGNRNDASGRTRFYDRTDPTPDAESGLTDAQFLDMFLGEWLPKNPWATTHVQVQLKVHGETDPVQPFPGYDRMTAEGIRQVVEVTDYDLMGLLKYELEVRPTQVDPNTGEALAPRDDVIDVLEDVAETHALTQIVDADTGVEGL